MVPERVRRRLPQCLRRSRHDLHPPTGRLEELRACIETLAVDSGFSCSRGGAGSAGFNPSIWTGTASTRSGSCYHTSNVASAASFCNLSSEGYYRFCPCSPPTLLPPPPPVSSTGPCKTYGNCACSSNYDASCTFYSGSKYKNNEECTVTFSSSAVLTSWAFSTEHVYDKVTVNGVQYSGSTGPDGVVASSMTWWSDGSVVRDGCGRSAKPN